MKLCPKCEQSVAEEITTCPACGCEVGAGRTHIDEYRILDVLHEGHATLLCEAVREPTGEKVMIRLFTRRSGVDEKVAQRLRHELEQLKALSDERFVQHQAIRRSAEGLWYRVSAWVEAESWGSLFTSGQLGDLRTRLDLFEQIAATLGVLHRKGHIIPHLILNDIMVVRDDEGRLRPKIDYKLSRFFDPKMDRPGPMLAQLLERHPDIVHRRPLDARSDIWSLGKVFVEVLAGDLDIPNHEAAVDALPVPDQLKVVLRVMLAGDPDLRPQSMDEIVEALSRLRDMPAAPGSVRSASLAPAQATLIRRLQGRMRLLAIGVVAVAMAGVLAWYLGRQPEDVETVLEGYANRYVDSVAFVVVDYGLEADGETVYRNVAEGTAFLADGEGYLLTSRHVVCPWLEDPRLLHQAHGLLEAGVVPRLDYRIYLWFEGQRAFNRAASLLEQPDVADFFITKDAFSNEHSSRRLTVAGVVRPTMRTGHLFRSPLNDDIAVIKIDRVPDGRTPLPLDRDMDPRKIRRLSRVIALGFPLGSSTQADTVNASAVDGHVRRSFRNMLQIDSSLHGGNSGGPIIDARGKVIGIVAAVAAERTGGLLETVRPLGDIGLILPITAAANLLAETKAGQVKWNGVLDFTLDATLKRIKQTALEGRWAEARALVEAKLEDNVQAELLAASGMLAFGLGELPAARLRFVQLRSMDPDNDQAKLMLYLIDWLSGTAGENPDRARLMAADWRSSMEFEGHLVRMLEGEVPIDLGVEEWYNRVERSWLNLVAGLYHAHEGDAEQAEARLQQAVLAADPDSWVFHVSLARLEQHQKDRRESFTQAGQWASHRDRADEFRETRDESLAATRSRQEQMTPLWAELSGGGLDWKERLQRLERLRGFDPDDFDITATLAFGHAASGDWSEALDYTREFLARPGRPTATRMSLGLLEAGVLHHQGSNDELQRTLQAFEDVVQDGWYLTLADCLLGRVEAESVASKAERSPEDLLTANMVLGFWAEGSGDKPRALAHYRTALGSFLDDWLEYGFARERIRRLKQPERSPTSPTEP